MGWVRVTLLIALLISLGMIGIGAAEQDDSDDEEADDRIDRLQDAYEQEQESREKLQEQRDDDGTSPYFMLLVFGGAVSVAGVAYWLQTRRED